MRQCVASAREVAARGVLLRVTFETLFEYLTVRPRRVWVPGSALSMWPAHCQCAAD